MINKLNFFNVKTKLFILYSTVFESFWPSDLPDMGMPDIDIGDFDD